MGGSSITSYTGNAGLGFGSNPGIPVSSPNDNLKIIQDTSRDIMLLDSERNLRLYNQKIRDRDSLTDLILKNQVSTKDIDEQYLPKFLSQKKDVEKAYDDWGGDFNNIKGYKKYQDTVAGLQDYAAHSQTNTAMLKKLQQERAAETLPWKQKQLDKWIDQQESKTKKDPWATVDPYQNLFSFSIDPINKLYKTSTGTSFSADGLFKYEDTYGDFNATLKNAQNEYLNNGETSEDMRQFFGQVEQYDPIQKKRLVESLNSQLQKYNQERGLQPGQNGYADPIEMVPGPDGTFRIKSDPATFSAKYSLAQQEKFTSRTPSFNKDFATYGLNKEKNEILAKKAGIEAEKADAYARNLNAKTNKWLKENKDQSTNIEHQYQDFVDNIKPAGIVLTDAKTKKQTGSLDAVFLDELPASYQYINGPIVGTKTTTTKDGKATVTVTGKVDVGRLEPYSSKDGRPYYIPRYVDPESGEKVSLDSDTYRSKFRESRKSGFPGSYDDYVRILLKKGAIEMVLQGKNGTANYTSMYQSAKTLNNEGAKKGQENIENPPPDESDETTPDY
jgi:hypothetical protein